MSERVIRYFAGAAAKILITGDIHFRSMNPVGRKDIYMDAVLTNLDEVMYLARQHTVDAILIPGDLFDSPSVSIPSAVRLGIALQGAPCPVLTIPGNHDIFAHNLESLPRTPYGMLSAFGLIRCVHGEGNAYGYGMMAGGMGVSVSGHGFDNQTDVDLGQYAAPDDSDNATVDVRIHMVHGMLLDKSPGFDMRHTLVSQLANIPQERQPHVLVCGHNHSGLAIQQVPGTRTLVINPGALERLSASMEEMERPIQVALLSVSSHGKCSAQYLPIKSAQPGHMVLSRDHIEAATAKNQRLEHFLSLLSSEGEVKFLEVRDIVSDIAARENLPENVQAEALRRIGEAREQLVTLERKAGVGV